MTRYFAALILAALAHAADPHPTGNRITPPTIASVVPRGVARGATTELVIEGLNLAKAHAIYFSEPGIEGRILSVKELPDQPEPVRLGSGGLPDTVDLGPLPPRNQVTVELDISPEADIGPVRFRLLTPLGTSPEGRFLIEPYYGESPDREPNNTIETAYVSYLPTILVGTIARPGDVDFYRIEVQAGDELVFEDGAMTLGSSLQPVISILTPDQTVIREVEMDTPEFAHRFEKAGTYYIRVADYQGGGSGNHFYRLKAGKFPIAVSAYPLGLPDGKEGKIALKGYYLDASPVSLKGEPSSEDPRAVIFRPVGTSGRAFNRVRLALGEEPEIAASGSNSSPETAQRVAVPVTINGRITGEHYFRFSAHKGERIVLEVNARRLGSKLDSVVEVLDAAGKPVERATVRCVWETTTTLSERDSVGRGIRLQAWNELAPGDYVMIGGEILCVEQLPRTPDEDVVFEAFGGQRLAFFDTSTEAHGIDKPVYKVQLHPPGARFAANGLPLVRLYYRNDDGGPGYGKDSLVRFAAPADGEYLARIRDAEGLGGDDYAYRLAIRPPRPDYELSVTPRNPNVPAGGRVPITVTALRRDDFDGPIEVRIENLPPGLSATSGTIAPGQVSTTLLLDASADARLDAAVPLSVVGRAEAGARTANPEDRLKLIALMPAADVTMTAETREAVVEPGGRARIAVRIQRHNGFGGRVPVEVRNLPPGVFLPEIGLNGILLNENEERRTFEVEALPTAQPIEQTIYVAGRVETRSPLPSSFAGEPIVLKVKPRAR